MGRIKPRTLCCWREKESTKTKKATPLPKGKLLVACTTLFVSQYGSNLIFPFLPFMVHDFFPSLDREELGRKAGFLGSAYFIGNFVGSLAWGWLADILGRRPVLMLGVCGIISSELLFGFSQNFAWAVTARFLWGILNGNIGVVKTYISEICDDSNQAKGFGVIGMTAGIGRLTGSITGGFLSQPASKYSLLQTGFFCKFPYILPCLLGAVLSSCSLIIAWLFLDETLHTKREPVADDGVSSENSGGSAPSNDSRIELSPTTTQSTDDSDTELLDLGDHRAEASGQIIIAESDIDTESDVDATSSDSELLIRSSRIQQKPSVQQKLLRILYCLNPFPVLVKISSRFTDCFSSLVSCFVCLVGCKLCRAFSGQQPSIGHFKSGASHRLRKLGAKLLEIAILFKDRRVSLSTLLYGLASFIFIIQNELLPLLLVTAHMHGGYNMDDTEISIVLMVAAIAQLLWQLFVFPRITGCIGYRRSYQLGALIFAAAVIMLPLSNRITGPVPQTSISGGGEGEWQSGSGGLSGNNTDYCGNDLSNDSLAVNVDSVTRIPTNIWVVVCLITMVIMLSRGTTLTSVMVLIGNSVLPVNRGSVNGIAQALAALGRSLGPSIGAPIFAWSEGTGKGWPLNFHFMFDLLAVLTVGVVLLSLLLPKSIEKKRDISERVGRTPSSRGAH